MNNQIHPHAKELARVTRHIMTVQSRMRAIARRILNRADSHDLSKFAPDELGGMIEIDAIAEESGLNSPQYMEAIKGPAIGLHRSRHSHHPEFHSDGIKDMSLLDLIEMVCDWKAANQVRGHPEGRQSVNMMIRRLELKDEYRFVVLLVADMVDELEAK